MTHLETKYVRPSSCTKFFQKQSYHLHRTWESRICFPMSMFYTNNNFNKTIELKTLNRSKPGFEIESDQDTKMTSQQHQNTSCIVGDVHWFILRAQLGTGGYATVFEVQDVLTNETYAMKRYTLESDGLLTNCILKELTVMQSLHHANAINVHFSFWTSRHVYIFMDLWPFSLHDILHFVQSGYYTVLPTASVEAQDFASCVINNDNETTNGSDWKEPSATIVILPALLRFVCDGSSNDWLRKAECTLRSFDDLANNSTSVILDSLTLTSSTLAPFESIELQEVATTDSSLRSPETGLSHVNSFNSTMKHTSSALERRTMLQTYLDPILQECGGRLPLRLILKWFVQIVDGLLCLHSHRFTSGDIKTSNILLDVETNKVCITDFNLAQPWFRKIDNLEQPTWTVCPPEYHALDNAASLNHDAVESWMLGCVLFQLLTQQCHLIPRNVDLDTEKNHQLRSQRSRKFWNAHGILFPWAPEHHQNMIEQLIAQQPCLADLQGAQTKWLLIMLRELLHPDPVQRLSIRSVQLQLYNIRKRPIPKSLHVLNTMLAQIRSNNTNSNKSKNSNSNRNKNGNEHNEHNETDALRTHIFRSAFTLWKRTPSGDDIFNSDVKVEILFLAIRLFDTAPSTHINHMLGCLLLAERMVSNTDFDLTIRYRQLGVAKAEMESHMECIILKQQQALQPASFYPILQHLYGTHSKLKQLQCIFIALLHDVQCARFHPLQLVLAVQWIVRTRDHSASVVNVCPSIFQDQISDMVVTSVKPDLHILTLTQIASHYIFPLLRDLVKQRQLEAELSNYIKALICL